MSSIVAGSPTDRPALSWRDFNSELTLEDSADLQALEQALIEGAMSASPIPPLMELDEIPAFLVGFARAIVISSLNEAVAE